MLYYTSDKLERRSLDVHTDYSGVKTTPNRNAKVSRFRNPANLNDVSKTLYYPYTD